MAPRSNVCLQDKANTYFEVLRVKLQSSNNKMHVMFKLQNNWLFIFKSISWQCYPLIEHSDSTSVLQQDRCALHLSHKHVVQHKHVVITQTCRAAGFHTGNVVAATSQLVYELYIFRVPTHL